MVSTTLEEERREVWGSVLEAVRQSEQDEDRAAACNYLLRHILDSALPPWTPRRRPARSPN